MNMSTTAPTHKVVLHRLSAGALTCALFVSLTAVPASADELGNSQIVEQIAAQVSAAAPDGAKPVMGTSIDGDITVVTGLTETKFSVDSTEAIAVSTSIAGEQLHAKITLPSGLGLGEGALASDGTVVYQSESEHAVSKNTVAVQTLSGGETRIQTVIADRYAQHEFGYGMEGFRAAVSEDGSAAFIADGPQGAHVPIEPAWAVDSNGVAVDTHYEIRGDKLFQIVSPNATTAYPVVADPTWGWRNAAWGLTLSRSETAGIKDYASAVGMCAALVKKSLRPALVACGVWASYALTQATTANKRSPKGCLHFVVAPLPGALSHTHC